MLPLAKQYGMSLNEFWYGDMRLLDVYQKAYMRDVSYRSWVNGNYTTVAHSIALSNAFAKKGQKQQEYPKWQDPIEKIGIKQDKITKDNLEQKFREQQIAQQDWLSSVLHKNNKGSK